MYGSAFSACASASSPALKRLSWRRLPGPYVACAHGDVYHGRQCPGGVDVIRHISMDPALVEGTMVLVEHGHGFVVGVARMAAVHIVVEPPGVVCHDEGARSAGRLATCMVVELVVTHVRKHELNPILTKQQPREAKGVVQVEDLLPLVDVLLGSHVIDVFGVLVLDLVWDEFHSLTFRGIVIHVPREESSKPKGRCRAQPDNQGCELELRWDGGRCFHPIACSVILRSSPLLCLDNQLIKDDTGHPEETPESRAW